MFSALLFSTAFIDLLYNFWFQRMDTTNTMSDASDEYDDLDISTPRRTFQGLFFIKSTPTLCLFLVCSLFCSISFLLGVSASWTGFLLCALGLWLEYWVWGGGYHYNTLLQCKGLGLGKNHGVFCGSYGEEVNTVVNCVKVESE